MKVICMDCGKEFEESECVSSYFSLTDALELMQECEGTEFGESAEEWLKEVGITDYQCRSCNAKLVEAIHKVMDILLELIYKC